MNPELEIEITNELEAPAYSLSQERRAREEAIRFEKDRYHQLVWDEGISPYRAKKQARQEASERYQSRKEDIREIAARAGLLPSTEHRSRTHAALEDWFRDSISPLLESRIQAWEKADTEQDTKDQECYYESRSVRWKFNRQVQYAKRGDHNDHGLGLYSYRKNGKTYRSWLGNQPLATPRQIAGMLSARHPGYEVGILHTGFTTSNFGAAAGIGGIVVPTYEAYITEKLPGRIHAYERLYLDHGRLLDLEDAERLDSELRDQKTDREGYAEEIARLCREAAPDHDSIITGWIELSEDGMEFLPFETDDTRDDYSREEVMGMLFNRGLHDDDGFVAVDRIKPNGYFWDDDTRTFGQLDMGSDMDMGRDIQLLLGKTSQQIEDAFLAVGEEATISEFIQALPKREASPEKVKRLRERSPENSVEF